jgi:hypothetical protein
VGANGNFRERMRSVAKKKKALAAVAVSVFIAVVVLSSSLAVNGDGQNRSHVNSLGSSYPAHNISLKESAIESGFFGTTTTSPIGIADAGVSANGSYSYSSTSFLGKIGINQLKVSGSQGKNLSFQLNLNLKFFYGGTTYVYWVQDVAYFNTTDNNIYFIDNVWNFSAILFPDTSSSMSNSTVSGNGSILSSSEGALYYDIANSSLPGNFVNLTEPSEIELMSNSTVSSSGSPEVVLRYNDGYGWVTYDNVVFKFARGSVSDSNFVVDGQVNNPEGLSYDAELIMGGPGGGSSTNDQLSNVTMGLQFWNGHNFQEITNAINYGLDTGETISNALSRAYYYTSNGTIYEKIVNGTEATGVVYYSSNISVLKVSSPFNNGIIKINGTPHEFIGGQVNLTLGPGNYSVSIVNNSLVKYTFTVDLRPGEVEHLYEGEYPVIFTEKGFEKGTRWWVKTDGTNYTTTSRQITIHVPNGSYSYVPGPDNNDIKSSGGEYSVNGGTTYVNLSFRYVDFNVTFHALNLPNGSRWGVVVNGLYYQNATSDNLTFALSNGSYSYTLVNSTQYYSPGSGGNFNVNGKNISINATFVKYSIIQGKIYPSGTVIYLNGRLLNYSGYNFSMSLVNGNYSLHAFKKGYYQFYYNFTVSDGTVITKNISLNRIIYPLDLTPYIGVVLGIVIFLIIYRSLRKSSKK